MLEPICMLSYKRNCPLCEDEIEICIHGATPGTPATHSHPATGDYIDWTILSPCPGCGLDDRGSLSWDDEMEITQECAERLSDYIEAQKEAYYEMRYEAYRDGEL